MANSIQYYLDAIKTAVYGRDVRDAIHDSIATCYADTTTGVNRATEVANSAATILSNAENSASAAQNTASQAANILATRISDFDTQVSQKILAYDALINGKVSSVDGYISQINAAKANAETAAQNAVTAANSINNLTVSYTNVGPNEDASVIMREIDGHRDIYIRLRQGVKGDSMVIKGTAYSDLAALKAAIVNPAVGDMYNVGATAPYTIYRWTGDTSVGSDGWESQGTFGSSIASVQTSEIDTIWSGSSVSGDQEYLDRDGLYYLVTNKIISALANKVNSEAGKGLISSSDQAKLDRIADGAEVNVQSDWNQTDTTADDYIKNKPVIPTGVVVDSALSSTSTNPVQNKAVKLAIDGIAEKHFTITDPSILTFTPTWSASSDTNYPYYADLSKTNSSAGSTTAAVLDNITANHFIDVVFGSADVLSGVYSPVCESRAGAIRLWATVNTINTVTLKTISAWG